MWVRVFAYERSGCGFESRFSFAGLVLTNLHYRKVTKSPYKVLHFTWISSGSTEKKQFVGLLFYVASRKMKSCCKIFSLGGIEQPEIANCPWCKKWLFWKIRKIHGEKPTVASVLIKLQPSWNIVSKLSFLINFGFFCQLLFLIIACRLCWWYTPLRKGLKFLSVLVPFKFDLAKLFYGLLMSGVKNAQKTISSYRAKKSSFIDN